MRDASCQAHQVMQVYCSLNENSTSVSKGIYQRLCHCTLAEDMLSTEVLRTILSGAEETVCL